MAEAEDDVKALFSAMMENNSGTKEGSDSSSLDAKSTEGVGSETLNLLETPFASPFQAPAFSAVYSKALAGVGFDGSAFNTIASEPIPQPEAIPVPKLKAEISFPFSSSPASIPAATLDSPSSPTPLPALPVAPQLADPPEGSFVDGSMTAVELTPLTFFSSPHSANLNEQMPFVFTAALVMLGTAVATGLSNMRKTDEQPTRNLSGDGDQVGYASR